MNTLNSMKRRMLALLAVLILTAVTATPAFAHSATREDTQATRLGTASIVLPKVETLRVRVIEEKTASGELRYTPAGSPQASPLYPMWYYTCYFEGIKVPCSFFAWLWD
jgi:hypothetical protein